MRLWRLASHILTALSAGAKWKTLADIVPVHDFARYQEGFYGDPPQQTFHSSSIVAPVLNYGTWAPDAVVSARDGSSHVFLTLGYEQPGPYVVRDDDLSLVYAAPSFEYTMNARVQTIHGSDFISFWHGARNRGDSQGYCVFYDQHYELVFNVTLGEPFKGDADMHECEVTPDGNVLLTAYLDKVADLSPLGGEVDAVMADGCFQEVRPETGEVVFSWCASDWFGVGLGYWSLSGPSRARDDATTSNGFDVYHINSLQKTHEGNYLVSLRNLKLMTYLDGNTGEPIWNLGGKINDFLDVTPASILAENPNSDGALSFGWQHHVRFLDKELSQITLFDNHELTNSINCIDSSCSRGRHLQVNTTDPKWPTVQLVHDYRSPNGLTNIIFGSMQALSASTDPDTPDRGGFLLGWGVSPEFSEYTNDGALVRDVQYGRLDPKYWFAGSGSVSSYRVLKHSWQGYPTWPPEVAISEDGTLWVSWNGATEVRSWAVYGSSRADLLGPESGTANGRPGALGESHPLVTVPRQGFETKIENGASAAAYVKVSALDIEGNVIGATRTLETGWTPSISSCLLQDTMSFTCLIRLLV